MRKVTQISIPFWLVELAGIAVIILLASAVHAQALAPAGAELPNAPVLAPASAPAPTAALARRILSVDNLSIAYDAASRLVLDPWSTARALGRGGTEANLPPQIADHPGMMVAYGAAYMGASWLVARELRRHAGRSGRWLARGIFAEDGTYDLDAVVRNFQVRRAAAAPLGAVYKFN